MQESTYSSLSEPYFERLATSLPSHAPVELQHVEAYNLFLESLDLQYKARLSDKSIWENDIINMEKEIAEAKALLDNKRTERELLEDQVAKQQGIAQLAKQKFERPTELRLESHTMSVPLNRFVSQLKESHSALEEENAHLEEDLDEILEEFDRRHLVVNEMVDAILRFRERYEDKCAPVREGSKEPEGTPLPVEEDEDEVEQEEQEEEGRMADKTMHER